MRERLHLRSQFANIGKVVSHFLKKVSRSAHMEKGKPDWVLVITKYQRVPAGRNGGSGSKHKALVCITHVAKFISFYYLVHWLPAMETFNWATTLFPPSLPKVMARDNTYYKKYRIFLLISLLSGDVWYHLLIQWIFSFYFASKLLFEITSSERPHLLFLMYE